ncbi:MAG: hypothetical protein JRE24_05755 [Deltaproteobacteria bacterium]|nr:hypothetical protein [Deltaproteobacteria bacterium]
MSKAAQGFSLRRTDRTPQTASSKAAGANPRRTPLIGKRAIYGWKLSIGYHIRARSAIIKPSGIIIPFWVCDLG